MTVQQQGSKGSDETPVPVDDGGADHLVGSHVPSVPLRATTGEQVTLSTLPGRTVVYCYPMTGVPGVALPEGWAAIPGARGCTAQAQAFHGEKEAFEAAGVRIFGLSTQDTDYQKEMSDRLGLSFPVLSDAELELTDLLRLPTFEVEGRRLNKRLTMVVEDGLIVHVFYPVFPADRAATAVLDWMKAGPVR